MPFKFSFLPPYADLAAMRETMSVSRIAERLGLNAGSVQRRLSRGPSLYETRDSALRRETILDCWQAGGSAKEIARAVSMTPTAVFGVVARARAEGDPRAVLRYRERNAS